MKQNTASQRIAAELRAQIRTGALAPGARAPSARQIMRDHGVAIATAMKALAILRKEGLVRPQEGVGTIVRGPERAPELSVPRIVEAAIAIADDEGTATLSMRTLARELGVSTMALYRHVESKEALLMLMTDAVLLEDPLPRDGDDGWRERLERYAQRQWAAYRRHPWVAQQLSITRPQALRNGIRHTEHLLDILDVLELDDGTLFRLAVTFIAYIRGMAVSLEAELEAEQDTGMTSEEWMQTQEATFAPLVSPLPILERLSRAPQVDMSIDALFACGLACFLDGIAAQALPRRT